MLPRKETVSEMEKSYEAKMRGKCVMKNLPDAEELEFVAESQDTGERVVFTMGDLYGWDDETVFLDTSIYPKRLEEVNWAIICKDDLSLGRRLNPEYHIHLRREEESGLIEPLRLLSIKQYSQYRFQAEFSNHVVCTGSLLPMIRKMAEWKEESFFDERMFFDEKEFEMAEGSARGLKVREDVFIGAKTLWKMSAECTPYGCGKEEKKELKETGAAKLREKEEAEAKLVKIGERLGILRGILYAIEHPEEVFKIMQKSLDTSNVKKNLEEEFHITDNQSQAIIDMRLRVFIPKEVTKLQQEIKDLKEKENELKEALSPEGKLHE